LEELEQPNQALESYLRVAIIFDHPELTPEAMVKAIKIHLDNKESNEAKLLLNDLLKRYPDSPWAKQAQREYQQQLL
jgi:TolA-binding protein